LTAGLTWTSDHDGLIGTGGSFSRVLSDGTHEITASATDSSGTAASDTITVTVNAAPGGEITLAATTYKVRGAQHADLTWSGATSTNVDVYRNGAVITTTANDGAYTDTTGQKGGGSATYKVCGAGTATCSNSLTVTW
jgi:hypothetical protein